MRTTIDTCLKPQEKTCDRTVPYDDEEEAVYTESSPDRNRKNSTTAVFAYINSAA